MISTEENGSKEDVAENPKMCELLIVESDLTFLNKKVDSKWLESCCADHGCFLTDHLLAGVLTALNLPGQRPTSRLIDLVLGLKRISVIAREENLGYSKDAQASMRDFICRFVNDSVAIVCYSTLDIWDNFLQSLIVDCQKNGQRIEDHVISNQICTVFMEKTTKYTVRALTIYLTRTGIELLDQNLWRKYYQRIGDHELITAVTDLIVFHASKTAKEDGQIDLHFDEIRCALLYGTLEVRKAIQLKLLPRMFKSTVLRTIFTTSRHIFLDLDDDFYLNADPVRSLEVVLLMTKFFVFDPLSPVFCWQDCIAVKTLVEALMCAESDLKMLAWHLICQNPRLTRPFSVDELILAKVFIITNVTEQHSAIRQRIATEFKAMMARIRESYKLLCRKVSVENVELFKELATSELFPELTIVGNDEDLGTLLLENQIKFLKEIHDFLFDSLEDGANFNRKLMSMSLIDLLHDSNTCANNGDPDVAYSKMGMKEWLNENCFNSLFALLDDGYEINQNLAEKLIPKLQFVEGFSFQEPKMHLDHKANLYKAKRFWIELSKEKRTLIIEEIGKLVAKECEEIEADIQYLGNEIKLTALIIYVNGLIQSFVIFELDKTESEKLILSLIRVGNLVSPVVHSLAPEGFWPEDASVISDCREMIETTKKAQQLLVNCWRTHKEVSSAINALLASTLDTNSSLDSSKLSHLPSKILKMITDYLFVQLTECRHCGAFEAAAVCFHSLCKLLWLCKDKSRTNYSDILMPDEMLSKLIDCLTGESDDSLEICETRRSAGLPPLICAILTTEPKERCHETLKNCMTRLFDFKNMDPTMVIHRVNCLCAIFENSELAETVRQYLTSAFLLCLQPPEASESNSINFSDHWPIRNTIARLFAAVIKRAFGKSNKPQKPPFIDAKCVKSANEFFVQLPQLYPVMVEILEKYAVNSSGSKEFHIYSLLTLLSHLTPSKTGEYSLAVFWKNLLNILFFSKGYKTRELTAVALITILTENEVAEMLSKISDKNFLDSIQKRNNALDGLLQLMVMIMERFGLDSVPETIVNALMELLENLNPNLEKMSDLSCFHYFLITSKFSKMKTKKVLAEKMVDLMNCTRIEGKLWLVGFSKLLTSEVGIWECLISKMNKCLRLECYKLASNVSDSIQEYLRRDFAQIDDEDELNKILQPFLKNPDYLNQELFQTVEKLLARPNLRKDICQNLMKCFVHLLRNKPLEKENYDLVCHFFDYASTSFEVNTRSIGLNLILDLAKDHADSDYYQELLDMALPSLQDENPEIRNEAAVSLGEFVVGNETRLCLNPTILWGIAVDKNPQLLDKLLTKSGSPSLKNGKSRVFALTELNPFAETKPISEIQLIKRLVSFLSKSC